MIDLNRIDPATWHKSSRSNGGAATCVEVAYGPGVVGVRDTKQEGRGPVLGFASGEFADFTALVKSGRYDLPALRAAAQ
jgi:hypothetical protein